MALSRKDYTAVAAAIAKEYTTAVPGAVRLGVFNVANRLADHFADDNSRFDRDRFLRAACPEGAPEVEVEVEAGDECPQRRERVEEVARSVLGAVESWGLAGEVGDPNEHGSIDEVWVDHGDRQYVLTIREASS